MSGEDGNGDLPRVLVSETYDTSSSEENESVLEIVTEAEETEHTDQLSYETISETPLEISSEMLEERSQSQELFPSPAADRGISPTVANEPDSHHTAQDPEGETFVHQFSDFLIVGGQNTGQV